MLDTVSDHGAGLYPRSKACAVFSCTHEKNGGAPGILYHVCDLKGSKDPTHSVAT